ncbi:class I SAM-dependent methyltransferase [Streptomyces sp. DSM 44917]|uniref:Class I SAM-dependent methyltransferase n=1 Tax=Streptomyces boetiae TaxID=3075541 RepID=A0ABU2LBM4_9ACTN|nr:class I SAM-dependent methyltransferase [Streptomyces sp. DSM 44917]MDT0308954.1 class I SAM-dependent methyltransferase [Streptomyces sp. DSM 44917]
MDAEAWEARYRGVERLFSGGVNGVLVAEAGGLVPGRALDVGCGEGGDALWLARRGWRVVGVDVSATALERAAAAGEDVADRVEWRRADVKEARPEERAFDLVSAQYLPLEREDGHAALRGLLEAVAPGGTLLFVGHDLAGLPPREELGVDPLDYYQPGEVAGLLGEDWAVEVDETRPRTAKAPAGTRHTHDTVLRARRRA